MSRYADLTRDELVARLAALESRPRPLNESSAAASSSTSTPAPAATGGKKKNKAQAEFQWGAQSTRHIAILVSYLGWPYTGLAIQPTSYYPTVEGELLKALEKTHLIGPGGWEACGFSRCGRTDRGVSGAGQVLNLWVRSQRREGDGGYPLGDSWRGPTEEKIPRQARMIAGEADHGEEGEAAPKEAAESTEAKSESKAVETETKATETEAKEKESKPKKEPKKKAPPQMDVGYPRLLNSVLPSSIRVLAWSPALPDFDARFSCKYRHYKYAFHLVPTVGQEPLDLKLMEEAAQLLLGEHDFRNFCKVDGSKQIENHNRTVLKAYFEADPSNPGAVVFNLIGNAFLWHQVRHIVAVLFLVGSKLEAPTVVSDLLDVTRFPGKPKYTMGDPIPLRLHECAYNDDAGLDWRFGPYDGPWQSLSPEEKDKVRPLAEHGQQSLERSLEAMKQAAEIKAWQIAGAQMRMNEVLHPESTKDQSHTIYPVGGGEVEFVRKYTPVVKREMGDTPDTINARWAANKGQRKQARKDAEAEADADAE